MTNPTQIAGRRGSAWQRGFAAVALIGAGVLSAAQVWAGSYLDRSALLISGATQESDYLRRRISDKELARAIHRLAQARLKAAGTMEVPKEVAQAHPHLLLILENYERAADSAENNQAARFLVYQMKAREEENVFRGILKQNGWSLPVD